jgi:RNA methyltransferase, TrmH family
VQDGSLIPRFGRARRDETLAVLEGFHPLKHALRFGAEVLEVACRDTRELDALAESLAPDVRERMCELAQAVDPAVFDKLVPLPPTTGVVSLARRPAVDVVAAISDSREAPVVVLENPRDLGNMGACVRVAAAADAAAVITTGSHDPWHPDALRGGAGLHFALAVARAPDLREPADRARDYARELIALDPDGEDLEPSRLPARAMLAFGSERDGASEELLARADRRVRIPMRAGVSSLNLATSVAAVLFAWRLSGPARG